MGGKEGKDCISVNNDENKKTTAMGLMRKKTAGTKFINQPIFEKEERILSWVLNNKTLEIKARKMEVVVKEDVEGLDLMNNAVIDDKVELALVRYMFDDDGWLCLQEVVKVKREKELNGQLTHFCGSCRGELVS